ncbi:MAG: trigger factor [Candidatus Anammoximicrobium sp.]|nr:trigger factor [Candidatus Anammoximicrobium sp.]
MNTSATDNDQLQDVDAAAPEAELDQLGQEEAQQEPKQRLELQVTVDQTSACERHVTVVIPRADLDRYFEAEFDDLVPKAEVPGFRPGKAPRKLVVNRFKEHIADQVKGKLLVDCLDQISEEQKFSAISEPDLNLDAVVLPDEGDMTFEFNLEVRPEFDMPEWKGLSLQQPRQETNDAAVDEHLQRILKRYGKLVDHHEPAEDGDYVTLHITFSRDGQVLSSLQDQTVVLKPKLSFRDAQLETFGELIRGAKAGDRREATLKISQDVDNEQMKGQDVRAEFEVVKVEKLQVPKLTPAFLNEVGGFTDEADLRSAVREELERQLKYRQQQAIRQQITGQLTANANWALPPSLLRKQTKREVQRMVLELQSAGFSNDVIQTHANDISRRSLAYTEMALKEHFILERLAEEHEIDAEADDYTREIELIAEQSGAPVRRVRARLEKRGEMDALRNQIIERKVIELITSHSLVEDVPYEPPVDDVVAIDHAVSGVEEREAIPEAHHGEEPKPLPGTPTHSG